MPYVHRGAVAKDYQSLTAHSPRSIMLAKLPHSSAGVEKFLHLKRSLNTFWRLSEQCASLETGATAHLSTDPFCEVLFCVLQNVLSHPQLRGTLGSSAVRKTHALSTLNVRALTPGRVKTGKNSRKVQGTPKNCPCISERFKIDCTCRSWAD